MGKIRSFSLLATIILVIALFFTGCGGGGGGNTTNSTNSNTGIPTNSASTNNNNDKNNAFKLPVPSNGDGPFTATDAIYVSPSGSDTNGNGTSDKPYYSLTKAMSNVKAGQGIYMRGGTYAYSAAVELAKEGTADAKYYIWAYPGEIPVINFQATSGKDGKGFLISGGYWHVYHIDIENASDNGVYISGSHNTIEYCSFHHNGNSGLQISTSTAKNNLVFNCDSYLNYDSAASEENGALADGFACINSAGSGNIFVGCRSWENSDNGWDLSETANRVTIINCWTWHNGDPNSFAYAGKNWSGSGNGFKLGSKSINGPHLVQNCLAFDNSYGKGDVHNGFDQNSNASGISIYNCLAWANTVNFSFPADPADTANPAVILKNNVAWSGVKVDTDLGAKIDSAANSWDLKLTVTADDFLKLDAGLAKEKRQSNGSLPKNDFAQPAAKSQLIDKGSVYPGIIYLPGGSVRGKGPDLGVFEAE
jgi:hypothetical protein